MPKNDDGILGRGCPVLIHIQHRGAGPVQIQFDCGRIAPGPAGHDARRERRAGHEREIAQHHNRILRSRHSIGIDIDSRNADLARERVGMWLTIEDGL